MTGALLLLGVGGLLLFVGFMSVTPEGLDRSWRRPEGLARGEERAGYSLMAAGGFLVAAGVTGLVAVWLAESDDPPLGVIVTFIGAAASWLWAYDVLYHKLRRPEPTSSLARAVQTAGRIGGKIGPGVFLAGVVLTAVL